VGLNERRTCSLLAYMVFLKRGVMPVSAMDRGDARELHIDRQQRKRRKEEIAQKASLFTFGFLSFWGVLELFLGSCSVILSCSPLCIPP